MDLEPSVMAAGVVLRAACRVFLVTALVGLVRMPAASAVVISSNGYVRPYTPPAAPAATNWPRARLVRFMDELVGFCSSRHVVNVEPHSTYGMTYEFLDKATTNRWTQSFLLDAMHDGGWFMSALITAHRANPDGGYLGLAQKFQAPFYCNMMRHSDEIFPAMQRSSEDNKNTSLAFRYKGWVPRGWDDGAGLDNVTGQNFPSSNTYSTCSNHLMQDMADTLLNLWLTTRDPGAALAALHARNYKLTNYGSIAVMEFAAGYMNGMTSLYRSVSLPKFTNTSFASWYNGGYLWGSTALPKYDDGLAWSYQQLMTSALETNLNESALMSIAAGALGSQMAMEMYFDIPAPPSGIYFFDAAGGTSAFSNGTGKLTYCTTNANLYVANNAQEFYGGRGIQMAWIGTAVLPYLAARTGVWEGVYYQNRWTNEALVRFTDAPPACDGVRDAQYDQSQSITSRNTRFTFLADPKTLHVFIQAATSTVEFALWHKLAPLHSGTIRVTPQGAVTATNEAGTPLIYLAAVNTGSTWSAELSIPFSIQPKQASWLNGVEHGRYAIAFPGQATQALYMVSEPARIVRRYENIALGAIQTWWQIWTNQNMMASAINHNSWKISDAGNYAHLIKLLSYWLIYQQGSSETEIVGVNAPARPLFCQPLPDSAIRLQGRTPPDTDQDGLSDEDETVLYRTQPTKADSDGDGMPDGAEICAGTDPNDPRDYLALDLRVTNRVPIIAWPGRPGISYQVQKSANLAKWQPVSSNGGGWVYAGSTNPLTYRDDPIFLPGRSFYRVGLQALTNAPVVGLDLWHNNEPTPHYAWTATDAGGFSQFGDLLRTQGAALATVRTSLTAAALAPLDLLIIVDPDTPAESPTPHYITAEEIAAVTEWVRAGGILVMMGNNAGNCEFINFNRLAGRFGMRFNEDTANTGGSLFLPVWQCFGMNATQRMHIVGMCSLTLTAPAVDVARYGGLSLLAAAEYGSGLVFAIGDPWIYNEYINTADNRAIAQEIFRRLLAHKL